MINNKTERLWKEFEKARKESKEDFEYICTVYNTTPDKANYRKIFENLYKDCLAFGTASDIDSFLENYIKDLNKKIYIKNADNQEYRNEIIKELNKIQKSSKYELPYKKEARKYKNEFLKDKTELNREIANKIFKEINREMLKRYTKPIIEKSITGPIYDKDEQPIYF